MKIDELTKSITLTASGVWVAKGHKDFGFLRHDDTNWLKIEEASFWYRHRAQIFLSIIRRYHRSGPIFEIGAGNGSVSIVLQNSGFEIIAIEPTMASAQNAKYRGVGNVICANLENANFPRGALANVGMFDVLEHIGDDREFIAKLRHLMPDHGQLFIAVPAYDWLWSAEDEYADHHRRYTLSRLKQLVERCGFQVEFGTYFFQPLILPIFLLRAVPSFLGLRRTRTAKGSEREHSLGRGVIPSVLEALLGREAATLEAGGRNLFGASCMLVAKAI